MTCQLDATYMQPARHSTYQRRNDKSIVNVHPPPQRALCYQPCEHRQPGSNQQHPGNDVEEGPDILTGSLLPRNGMVGGDEDWRHCIALSM